MCQITHRASLSRESSLTWLPWVWRFRHKGPISPRSIQALEGLQEALFCGNDKFSVIFCSHENYKFHLDIKRLEQDHQEMDFEKDYFSSLSLDKKPRA